MKSFFLLFSLLLFHYILPAQNTPDYYEQWPQFRGAFARGIVEGTDLPDSWDMESGENIRWSVKIPGLGHSCPVIWNDRIFVTTAVSSSGNNSLKPGLYGDIDDVDDESVHDFMIMCFNLHDGSLVWERTAVSCVPKTRRHTKSSHANPTPATDGKYVVAFFGSNGMFCYDFDGNLIWERDFPKMNTGPYNSPQTEWGFGGSPVIFRNRVILQCDFIGDSFLATYNLETGQEIWKSLRDEISTWSTPNCFEKDGKAQIVVNGWKHMGGYDFETGREIWKLSGGGDAPVPVPLIDRGLIYIHNAHGRYSPIYAIRQDVSGDISPVPDSADSEFFAWRIERGGAYMPTAVVYGDYLYNMRMNGYLSCFNALTGDVVYKEMIPEARGITASGIASEGKLYYSTEQGDVYVVKAGPEFEIIAKNNLGDIIMATPAISRDLLVFRTQHYLIGVGKDN